MVWSHTPIGYQGASKRDEKDDDLFQFGEGFSAGIDTTIGTLSGARAIFNEITGDDEEAFEYLGYAQDRFKAASESGGTVTNWEDIEGAGDYLRWASYSLGTIAPSLATSIVSGGIGGALAQGAAKKFAKDRISKEVRDSLDDTVSEKVKQRVIRETLEADTRSKRLLGQGLGAFADSAAQNSGATFVDIYEETGIQASDVALAAGVVSGGLDAVTPFLTLKKIMPDTVFTKLKDGVADKLVQNGSVTRRVLLEGSKQAGIEGFTEASQELIQATAVGMMKNDINGGFSEYFDQFVENISDPDQQLQSRILNAALVGALGGTATGTISGAFGKDSNEVSDPRKKTEPEEDQDPSPEVGPEPTPSPQDSQSQERVQGAQEDQRENRRRAQGFPQSMPDVQDRDVEAEAEARVGEAQARGRAAARRAQGLPETASDRIPTTPLEARNARYEKDLNDSLRRTQKARKIINQIIPVSIFETGDATPEENAQAQKDLDQVEVVPSGPAIELGPDRTMKSLVGSAVDYQGISGTLSRREDGVYVVIAPQGNEVVVESGQSGDSEAGITSAASVGVKLNTETKYNAEDDTFVARGKTYRYVDTQRNEDGEAVAIQAETMDGKPRVFKSQRTVQSVEAERANIQAAKTQPTADNALTQGDSKRAFSQVEVEMDDLPASVQRKIIEQSNPESIPDQVSVEEAINTAESMPNAESLVEVIQEAASFRAVPLKKTTSTPQAFTQTIRRPDKTVLSEAIAEINKKQPSQRTDIDEEKIDSLFAKEAVPFRDGNSFVPVNDADAIATNAKAEIKTALIDLFDAGMPKAFLRDVNGIYVHGNMLDNEVNGIYAKRKGFVSIYNSLIKSSAKDQENQTDAPAKLRYVLAHELGHAFDVTSNHTANAPEFSIEINGLATTHVDFELGPIMAELADNFNNKTELGLEFAYPFGTAFDMVNTKREKGAAIVRQEAFAQAFAVFHSSPETLKEYAPITYNYMQNLLQSEQIDNGQSQNTSTTDVAEASGVRGEVRPQTELRGVQVQDGSGDRGDGGRSPVAEQAGQGMGQPPVGTDGDSAGRPVQLEEAQQTEEERLAEEAIIAEEAEFENDLNSLPDDDMLFAPFARVPAADEQAPILPMGKVEQSLSDLLAENPNPTAEQLGSISGSPKKRKGKESVEDADVRPVTLDELRGYIEESLSVSDNLKWYDEFGNFFRDLVGDANLDEASVIFGVTSAQNSAENNLSETLHIMSLARKFNPVTQRKQFELAVKETPRAGGRKLMVTGDQIKRIADLYEKGDFSGGIKTTTYMQMVQDRGRNLYNPFSVQDVHMSRIFGFRRKDYKKNKDGSQGALLDAAKIGSENEYRYAQYLTSVLADEYGMSPNQMQATLWFYAKQNLSPLLDSNKKGSDGTLASAVEYSKREIEVIEGMVSDGTFDTSSAASEALVEGVRPSNKPAQKTTPFSTVNEREQLMEVARARSPKLIASAVAGKDRGLAFPEDTPIETLIQYNQDVMAAIVDDGGQIPILRELGIPHEISESAGTFTGYEPSIMIRLMGGTMETADKLAPLLGDALLQDAVITSQAVYGDSGLPAFQVVKNDGSDFSREDAMALTESLNPNQDPDGINFNQPMNDTLMFLDPRSLDDSNEYTDLQAKEFYSKLADALGDGYSIGALTTEGTYHGSDRYREAIERAWNPEGSEGRADIYDRTNASLYEPVRKVYNEYAERLGIPKREAQDLDLLSSPPSSPAPNVVAEVNEERNAVIREEKKAVDQASSWLTKTFKRQLTSRGLLNEQVFQAKIARDGEFGSAEIDTRMYLNSYDKAVKDADLTEEQTALLSEAIATPLDQLNSLDLPDTVKQAVGGMRKYLDKMSIDYATVVADQALQLAQSGKGEAAAAKADLLNTIVSNKGKYLNRSYQVFDDPKWANKVSNQVIDDARAFLESNGAQNADRIINTILKEGTAFDGLSNFISEGNLGSKDLSILKKRKDIAPEILALMGEYTDPRINFVKTATKVSRLLWNHRFLERVKLEGERDGFLFTAEDAPTEAYVQIAPDSSDAMNPLNGLYTTPELAQGFKDAMDLGSNEAWVQTWQQINSVVKYGKTVVAPTTVARNFMSASLFTIANGHFNWAKADASLKSLDGYFSSKEGDATAYLREIRRLGVVYDSPYAGELTKALEDFSKGTELDNRVRNVDSLKGKAIQKSKSFLDLMAKNYQYGDDFWKIIGFENMVDVLMENKGISREEAMPLAAERIRDTYPTYSLIGKGIKDLRRFPLVGTFVSFPAEIVRTSFNMFKYLKQDMADPDMKGHAMAKVAGMSAVSFGVYALQDAALRAFDVDEEELEAIRLMSPTWSENSNILPTGRDENGNLEYIDLTYLDPYAYFKKPINALMRDQPTEDAIVQAGRELLVPFFGVDIATNTALEIYNNEKVSGGRIWNPADTPANKLSGATQHLIKGAGPAVIQNVLRTAKAVEGDVSKSGKRYELEDELKAWVGFRVTTFDPKVSLHFKAYEFNQDKRNATSLLTSTFRDPNQLDAGELENAFARASTARKEGYERMIKLVSSARKSGLNNTQLMMVLRSNGVTKNDARALIAGNPATWKMSDSTLKNSIKKSDLLFGRSTGIEFEKRWRVIQQLLREESQ